MPLYRRADGTVLTADCPVGITAARKRDLRIATPALSSALSFASVAAAQVQQTLQLVSSHDVVSGKVTTTETDEKGQFQIAALPIGRYEIRVESPGFERFTQTVVISQFRAARVDAKLQLGALVGEVMPVKPHDKWNPFAKLHL